MSGKAPELIPEVIVVSLQIMLPRRRPSLYDAAHRTRYLVAVSDGSQRSANTALPVRAPVLRGQAPIANVRSQERARVRLCAASYRQRVNKRLVLFFIGMFRVLSPGCPKTTLTSKEL